jgi:hypothetical protein
VKAVDDLGVVDALEIDERDADVAVAELALDDHDGTTCSSNAQQASCGPRSLLTAVCADCWGA